MTTISTSPLLYERNREKHNIADAEEKGYEIKAVCFPTLKKWSIIQARSVISRGISTRAKSKLRHVSVNGWHSHQLVIIAKPTTLSKPSSRIRAQLSESCGLEHLSVGISTYIYTYIYASKYFVIYSHHLKTP